MFSKWAKSEGIADLILKKAVEELDQGLLDANLGGSLIKKRIARKGQRKRGSFRTIVVFQKGYKIFFVYGFAKNQSDNISDQEIKALKKLAKDLLDAPEVKLNEMIINGNLYEVGNE